MVKTEKIFQLTAPFAVALLILITGCEEGFFTKEKDEDYKFEIKAGSDQKVIRETVKGIGFRFGLFNEDSQAATTFAQGENFLFNLNITNETDETIQIQVPVVHTDFFKVYRKTDNQFAGSPIQGVWCEYSNMPENYESEPGYSLVFKHPWEPEEDESITKYYPFCSQKENNTLKKGEYFTKLKFNLEYSSANNNALTKINDVIFKINFQIN